MSPLDRYVDFMENVATYDLDTLGEILAEDIHFVDPFNDTVGKANYQAIIEDMRHQVTNLDINVISRAMVLDDGVNFREELPSEEHSNALIRWRLSGNLNAFSGRPWQVEGCSAVSFDPQGLVREHLDYWDAAGQLYEGFPVIGRVFRCLRRKLATI